MPQPVIIQQVSGASSVAAPANFTLGGIAATTAGTLLVLHAAAATSAAATIGPPTGWIQASVFCVNGTVLRGNTFVLPNNPGGITSVTTGTLTNVNGIACALYEVSGMPPVNPIMAGALSTFGNSTSPATSVNEDFGGAFWTGYEADVTGQAYTLIPGSGTAPGGPNQVWVGGTAATSTLGATNVAIHPASCIGIAQGLGQGGTASLSGTLAGAINWVCVLYECQSLVSTRYNIGNGGAVLVTGGSGYSSGT